MKLANWLILIHTHIQSVYSLTAETHWNYPEQLFILHSWLFERWNTKFCSVLYKSWFIVISTCVSAGPCRQRDDYEAPPEKLPNSTLWERCLHVKVDVCVTVSWWHTKKNKELCETWISCQSDLQSGLEKYTSRYTAALQHFNVFPAGWEFSCCRCVEVSEKSINQSKVYY